MQKYKRVVCSFVSPKPVRTKTAGSADAMIQCDTFTDYRILHGGAAADYVTGGGFKKWL